MVSHTDEVSCLRPDSDNAADEIYWKKKNVSELAKNRTEIYSSEDQWKRNSCIPFGNIFNLASLF